MTMMDSVIKAHQATKSELIKPGPQLWNADSLRERIDYLRKVDTAALVIHMYWFLVSGANLFAGNPAALCYQVILECKVNGEPTMDTLQRLKPWLDEHLNVRKMYTLRDGLKIVQKARNSGQMQKEIADEYKIEDRTFRDYLSWWRAIDAKGSTLSYELKVLYTSIIDNKTQVS